MTELDKPLLIYDGDCNFCRRWVGRWRTLTGSQVDYEASQKAAERFPKIKRERFAAAVVLVEPDGKSYDGAEAVFRVLTRAPGRRWLYWAYRKVPGVAQASESFYTLVARQRRMFSTLTRMAWGADLEPPTYHMASWLFLRLLGLIYLAAFVSLWVQAEGLIGSNGILPASELLRLAKEQLGGQAYRVLPTLFWLSPTDSFLHILCGGGAALAILVVLGVAPGPLLLLLWAFYLSLMTVGRDFLSFQWDILLLEAGLLAVFLAPWKPWPRWRDGFAPSPGALWLLRWLLFRLMFESGCVKLLSGDKTWWSLTALTHHYETQPLPTWLGWYAHQLPQWFHRFSAGTMFAIELAAPFLIFMPRRPRILGFTALVWLQCLIGITGNYCFFNLLAVALCLLLVDDAVIRGATPKKWSRVLAPLESRAIPGWRRGALIPLTAFILFISGLQLYGMLVGRVLRLPGWVSGAVSAVEPLRLVNSYGLFAVMTTSRPEIVVEGSSDGRTWKEYSFKWKPGDLKRRPAFVEPHQPRLDWQMWFAALSNYQSAPWFLNFMVRLLQGSPEVLALLENNPFPEAPPRFARALVYEYRFSNFAEKKVSGAWWGRELKGLYCPVLSLRENK